MQFLTQFKGSIEEFPTIFQHSKVVHVFNQERLDADNYFRKLSHTCGVPLIYEEDPVTGAIDMNKWTEIKYEPEKSSDSYKSSNKSQPLHTDYGYFSFEIYAAFFYCVTQAAFGGATTFVDAETVISILKALDPLLLDHLQREKIQFGRAENPIARNTDYIIQKDALGWKINWNYYRALGDEKNRTLIDDFKGFLDNFIEKSGELTEIKLKPGEGVFFQDRRVLHGRNSFAGDRQLNKGAIVIPGNLPLELKKYQGYAE